MLETAMTSMELPGREMGQRAADMILEDIEAADDEKPSVQHMVFGTKLIERDDVGKDSQMGISDCRQTWCWGLCPAPFFF